MERNKFTSGLIFALLVYLYTQYTMVQISEKLFLNEYFDEDGIFRKDWRNGDSIWSLVSKKTLLKVVRKVYKLKMERNLKAFIYNNDNSRLSCGQITFTFARK